MSKRIQISNAQQLLEAMSDPDMARRAALFKSLSSNPAKALSYGPFEGMDVVDALIEMASVKDPHVALMPCTTLTAFSEPRVLDFFLERLAQADGKLISLCTVYLMAHPTPRDRVYPILLANESILRVRAAARVLNGPCSEDPPEVALRLALLRPDCSLPPVQGAWLERWIAELKGVVSPDARAGLRSNADESVLGLLLTRFEEFSVPTREWLLDWAAGCCYQPARERVLASVLDQPQFLRTMVRRHPQAWDWLKADLPCPSSDLQLSELLDQLEDPDWRNRAAAVALLVERGGVEVLEAVRPRALSPCFELRTAAVTVLLGLGEHEWLEEHVAVP